MSESAYLIKQLLEGLFSKEKIRQDFFSYLDWSNLVVKGNNGYEVRVYNESTEQIEHLIINEDDELTIITYKYVSHLGTDMHYYVTIGVGVFTPDVEVPDLFNVTKCLALMSFNHDLSHYDTEFKISRFNRHL